MARNLITTIPNRRPNLIINGDFEIGQRDTSFNSIGDGNYGLDRFRHAQYVSVDVNQSTDVPSFEESNHTSTNSLEISNTSTGSPGASDTWNIQYRMEGFDFKQLFKKFFTLSFWIKSTQTGIFNLSFTNVNRDRSYIADVSINQPDVWEKKVIIVKHNATGTWNLTNGIGVLIRFSFSSGSDFIGQPDIWQSGNLLATSNQTNFAASTNTIKLSQVMLNEGKIEAPFQKAGRNFAEEFILAQRYFISDNFTGAAEVVSSSEIRMISKITYPTLMRTIPSINFSSVTWEDAGDGIFESVSFTSFSENVNSGFRASFNNPQNRSANNVGGITGSYEADAEL